MKGRCCRCFRRSAGSCSTPKSNACWRITGGRRSPVGSRAALAELRQTIGGGRLPEGTSREELVGLVLRHVEENAGRWRGWGSAGWSTPRASSSTPTWAARLARERAGGRAGRAGRLHGSGVRPRHRRARPARHGGGPTLPRTAAVRGRHRGQQQRRRAAPDPGRAGPGRRSHCLPRRAGGDRRIVSHPRNRMALERRPPREVGTTNRTRAADYAAALGGETRLILQVHRSNFEIVGFTETPATAELLELSNRSGVPLVMDAGSGYLFPQPGMPAAGEPVIEPPLAQECRWVFQRRQPMGPQARADSRPRGPGGPNPTPPSHARPASGQGGHLPVGRDAETLFPQRSGGSIPALGHDHRRRRNAAPAVPGRAAPAAAWRRL